MDDHIFFKLLSKTHKLIRCWLFSFELVNLPLARTVNWLYYNGYGVLQMFGKSKGVQFWLLEFIIIIYYNNWLLPSHRWKKFQLTLSIKRSANNTIILSYFIMYPNSLIILEIDRLMRKDTSLKFTLKIFLLNHKYYLCRFKNYWHSQFWHCWPKVNAGQEHWWGPTQRPPLWQWGSHTAGGHTQVTLIFYFKTSGESEVRNECWLLMNLVTI